MINASRSAKIAALCFVLVAGSVLGGLAWATVASVRLERAQDQAAATEDHNRRLRLALWRVDSLVMNVLATEASRPYWYYSTYYYPSKALLTTGEELTGSIIEPSPLRNPQTVAEWILLYFQVSPRAGWNSPQLPLGDDWWTHDEDMDSAAVASRQALLAGLEHAFTPDAFAQRVADASTAAQAQNRWVIGEERADVLGERRSTGIPQMQQSEYQARGRQTILAQEVNRPPQACDPIDVAFNNLSNTITTEFAHEDQAETSYVSVSVSPMTAMWLPVPSQEEPLLAMVRVVEAEGNQVYQGFIVDWQQLSALLVERIADLFDSVELQVIEPGTVEEPETTMTALPVRLVTGAPAVVATAWWTVIDTSLLLAWGAALLALVAIGVGVRSLLMLTHRRSRFAYAVTHELRTPMTTLCLYTDMLASGLVNEEKKAEYFTTLRNESQRLSDLVTGILEYAQVENRTVRPELHPVSVGGLFESVRERYEPQCRKANMELVTETNDLDHRTCATDPRLVLQILGNLIDNSCKYAAGNGRGQITLRAGADKNGLAFDVEDTGPGISGRDRRRIFKPFRRGRLQASTVAGGTGLGLALARSWAKLLGGRLDLRPPTAGRGARFRLSLPASAA